MEENKWGKRGLVEGFIEERERGGLEREWVEDVGNWLAGTKGQWDKQNGFLEFISWVEIKDGPFKIRIS